MKKTACLFCVVALFIFIATSASHGGIKVPGLSKPNLRHSTALAVCQYAIKGVSRDQKATKVPYAKNQGGSGEFYYAWNNSNPIKMPNGFGAMVPTSGACIVSQATGEVTYLSINGKTIVE